MSTLTVAISIVLVFSFTAAASCQPLDDDSRTEAYSKCHIWLSKQSDLDDEEDYYYLRMIIASRIHVEDVLPNSEWSGPIRTNIYVYLPGDTSDVLPSPPQGMWPASQPQGSRFEPEIETFGSFVRLYWKPSSERFGYAESWSFIDQLDYSLMFVVPQNASVTVYAYVQTVSYTYHGVYYSQLADERMYWLEVSNTDEATAPPQAIETGAPILILDTLGIYLIVAAVFSVAAFWHYKLYGQHSPGKTGIDEQGMLKMNGSAHHTRTVGIMILAAVVAFMGILGIFAGSSQLGFSLPWATKLLVFGLGWILTAPGLFWLKPWAWYAAVGLTIISIVDYLLLFTITALSIPLAPFILVYLIVIRHRFF